MKKIFTLISATLLTATFAMAQSPNAPFAEQAPGLNANNQNPSVQTPWQVLFSYDITAAGAGVGNAGVAVLGNEIWVSRWGSDTISTFSPLGILISQFTVAGVTGVRSLTTDGTSIYAGANTSSIFKIDPVTKTLTSTIVVSTVPNIRYCTYDASANSGAGGFWVGTWTTDFSLVDMSGLALDQVLATSHLLTATYGLTLGTNGKLWAFHQTGATNAADIIQVDIATGTQTAVMHDVTTDMGVGGDLAGGIFYQATPPALVGVLQSSPANLLFSYDVAGLSSINDLPAPTAMIEAFPNPANETVNIRVKHDSNEPMQIRIVDVLGNVVSESNNVGINNIFNIASYDAGVYFVQVTQNGTTYTTKIVKN